MSKSRKAQFEEDELSSFVTAQAQAVIQPGTHRMNDLFAVARVVQPMAAAKFMVGKHVTDMILRMSVADLLIEYVDPMEEI